MNIWYSFVVVTAEDNLTFYLLCKRWYWKSDHEILQVLSHLEDLSKTTKSLSQIVCVPAEISSRNIFNISQEALSFQPVRSAIFFTAALPASSGPRPLIQFRNRFSQTVEFLGIVISPSQGRYLNTGQHKHRINAYKHQTSMLWAGFGPTIPAPKWAKTVHALDRVATWPAVRSAMAVNMWNGG
jgi:hypothetical protein